MPHKRNYNCMHWHKDHLPHKSSNGRFSREFALLLWLILAYYVAGNVIGIYSLFLLAVGMIKPWLALYLIVLCIFKEDITLLQPAIQIISICLCLFSFHVECPN